MYTYTNMYVCMYFSLSLSIYIYIYIHTYISLSTYIYIYIYMCYAGRHGPPQLIFIFIHQLFRMLHTLF